MAGGAAVCATLQVPEERFQRCNAHHHYRKAHICYPKGCAATSSVQCQCNARGSLSKLAGVPPRRKINVTSKSPVGDISVVTLIRTDTTLDHSQKAEKVWVYVGPNQVRPSMRWTTRRVQLMWQRARVAITQPSQRWQRVTVWGFSECLCVCV